MIWIVYDTRLPLLQLQLSGCRGQMNVHFMKSTSTPCPEMEIWRDIPIQMVNPVSCYFPYFKLAKCVGRTWCMYTRRAFDKMLTFRILPDGLKALRIVWNFIKSGRGWQRPYPSVCFSAMHAALINFNSSATSVRLNCFVLICFL